MTFHLSERYRRSQCSVAITVTHSACLLFKASVERAYVLTITALPSQLLPSSNERNAPLIQSFMADCLGVEAARGVIRFVPVPEACLVTDGRTMLVGLEHLKDPPGEMQRTYGRSKSRPEKARSTPSSRERGRNLSRRLSPPPRASTSPPPPLPTMTLKDYNLYRRSDQTRR